MAKYVIHTVGPVWKGGQSHEEDLLGNCYQNSLELGAAHGVKSIAFPNISTGAYRFPKELAAKIALNKLVEYIKGDQNLEKVIFVCFDDENYEIYSRLIKGQ